MMRMHWLVTVIMTALLSACAGNPAGRAEARFDFGPQPAAAGDNGIAAVVLTMPSWLDGDAMQYRLLYADPARRFDYGDSRWVASPAELLTQALENRLGGGGRCRLVIDLNEFIQEFESPGGSRFLLDARATLLLDQDVLASRIVSETQPAPSADARGGVAAATQAIRQLGETLAGWTAAYGGRCRSG
jgi:cholesterol transport system auxiliary component